MKQYSILCNQKFAFLLDEFKFKCIHDKIEDWGFEKHYIGRQVGIILHFEKREFYLFVEVSHLIDGQLPPNIGEITADSILYTFDLDDIVTLRAKQSLISRHDYKICFDCARFKQIVDIQSKNLRLYAADILNGDFSLFEKLEIIVKLRAKDAAIKKWGARAIEFGWHF